MTAVRREYLLDVSRMIWRLWSGRHPTGIDRVCLEYIRRFRPQSQAVIQYRRHIFVFAPATSDRLFGLLVNGRTTARIELAAVIAGAMGNPRRARPRKGMLYLNVGHTGLDEPALPRWIAESEIRAVYLVHDLIPLTHPQFCREGEAARHARRMRNVLGSASGIIANSGATLEQLARFASEAGFSMPPSVTAWISGPHLPSHLHSTQLERPYFVTVGTIEGRKNHILLLNVWRELIAEMGDHAPILVIIGQRGWQADAVEKILDGASDLQAHVRELADCGDDELARWVRGARALLMPSLAEGFGLPVIEALQVGTPVIAADLPVYREVVGNIPTYLSPLDQCAWKRAIADFVTDGDERSRQMRAMQDFKYPSWQEHFSTVDQWLRELPLAHSAGWGAA